MRRAHVLVLERNRDLREALVEGLLDEGYIVTPAPSAAALAAALRSASPGQLPDLLVMDADDDGEALALLREDPRYAGVALVTLSFGLDPVAQADVDVHRPFRLEDLLQAVRVALERHGFPLDDGSSHAGA